MVDMSYLKDKPIAVLVGKALSPLIILMKLDKNYTINEGFSLKVIFPLHCYDRKKRN